MRSSLSVFAPPGSRNAPIKHLQSDVGDNDDRDDAGVVGLDAEHETCVVRYFQTRLLLRYVAASGSDDADSSRLSTEKRSAAFLSIYEPHGGSSSSGTSAAALAQAATLTSSSLLNRTPAMIVLPPVEQKSQSTRVTTAVFSVIPAEGFEKEPGQPVCYNDPVELVDQFGRILGIASRSPHVGHVAVDNHGGALVVIFERRRDVNVVETSAAHSSSQSFTSRHAGLSTVARTDPQYQLHKQLGLRRTSTGVPATEICGGDRVAISGLVCVRKKPFMSGCIMQHQFFSVDSSATSTGSLAASPLHTALECEVVMTSSNTPLPIDVNPLLGGSESVLATSKRHMADRTATGEFVGVLHHGVLRRRTDHMKLWKKRFFVLTQVALHRFDPHVTLASSRSVTKSRGDLRVRDCRRIRYEKFARPHELDIELVSGKLLSLQADDAVTCAKWASVLSYAIESPQWIHAERSFTTIWRSSERYESPKCPVVDKIELAATATYQRHCHKLCARRCCCRNHARTVAERPQWSEKLALGELNADDQIVVHLSSGSRFTLSLDDLSRALLAPLSSIVHTIAEVDSITDHHDTAGDSATHSSSSRSAPLFVVRLRYRTELQLDRRIDIQMELGLLQMRLKFASALLLGGLVPLYVALRHYRGIPLLSLEWVTAWRLECVCTYQMHALAVVVEAVLLAAIAPLLWHAFSSWYRQRIHGARLQWFVTLVSLEVQPEAPHASMTTTTSSDSSTRASRPVVSAVPSSDCETNSKQSQDTTTTPQQRDDIYRFRLENALETILGRPHFPYFAIKQFFPNAFVERDEHGRRVLRVALHAVDLTRLASHNVSPFAVERYFLYVWEFIWSYSDLVDGVAHSELTLVLDCTNWRYTHLFGRSIRIMNNVLRTTHTYYPGRLARVVVQVDSTLIASYARVFCASLPLALRAKCSIERVAHGSSAADAAAQLSDNDTTTTAVSRDELALAEFAHSLLSTYATVSIPSFTQREVDQATRFTKVGSLQSTDDARTVSSRTSSGVGSNSSSTRARVGTRALLIPAAAIEWRTVYQRSDFSVCMSSKGAILVDTHGRNSSATSTTAAPSTTSPQIAQVRGTMAMKSTDTAAMLQCLHDPSQWRFWNPSTERMTLLDTLSSREDVCFWSRQIPFLGYSHDGNRIEDVQTTDSYFNCLVRRIYDERPPPHATEAAPSFTVLWKTTTSQQSIIYGGTSKSGTSNAHNDVKRSGASEPGTAQPKRTLSSSASQWKRFEDPTITVCFVLEPRSASQPSGLECTAAGIDLSFWYQVLLPTQRGSDKVVELAQALETKFRSLDTYLERHRS